MPIACSCKRKSGRYHSRSARAQRRVPRTSSDHRFLRCWQTLPTRIISRESVSLCEGVKLRVASLFGTEMSRASDTFARSILDAENLLTHFNTLNTKPPPPELEVLKLAGLAMAMTAWETYVEDRVLGAAAERLHALADKSISVLARAKLDEEIKRLHNPTAEKTSQLFRDYAAVDLMAYRARNNNTRNRRVVD
jgi:hypothetical protein